MFGIYKNPRCRKSHQLHRHRLFTTADGETRTAKVMMNIMTLQQYGTTRSVGSCEYWIFIATDAHKGDRERRR